VNGAEAAGFAGVYGVVGDVPGTTVDDERGSHVRKKKDIRFGKGSRFKLLVLSRGEGRKNGR